MYVVKNTTDNRSRLKSTIIIFSFRTISHSHTHTRYDLTFVALLNPDHVIIGKVSLSLKDSLFTYSTMTKIHNLSGWHWCIYSVCVYCLYILNIIHKQCILCILYFSKHLFCHYNLSHGIFIGNSLHICKVHSLATF